MVLFRRFCVFLTFLIALATGFVAVTPTAFAAKECQCGCSTAGGPLLPNGGIDGCTTDAQCTIAFCNSECALNGPGVYPAQPPQTQGSRGPQQSRVYRCVEVSNEGPTSNAISDEQREYLNAPPSPAAPTPTPAPGARTGTPAPTNAGAPRRGSCSFQCVPQTGGTPTPGAAPQTPPIIVQCSANPDCAAACTSRCQTAGSGPAGNGLRSAMVCASPAAARCILPQADTTANPAAGSSGGALRFQLPTCTETGNCTLTDIINTAVRFANFLIAASGVIFFLTFIYAGAWLLFFAYDSSAIKKAKDIIVGATVGMIIIMVAGVAIRFVSTSLGVPATTTRLPGSTTPSPSGTGLSTGSRPSGLPLGSSAPSTGSGSAGSGGGAYSLPAAIPGEPMGSCSCGLSTIGSIAMARARASASASEIAAAQAQAAQRCRSQGGTPNVEAITCVAPTTEAQCDAADNFDFTSCDWTGR